MEVALTRGQTGPGLALTILSPGSVNSTAMATARPPSKAAITTSAMFAVPVGA
jgi:hypothetical protein